MRITEPMVEQFYCNADVVSAPHGGKVRSEITAGLVSVAPMIAEAAVSGYIEQGHRLRQAESLLRAAAEGMTYPGTSLPPQVLHAIQLYLR